MLLRTGKRNRVNLNTKEVSKNSKRIAKQQKTTRTRLNLRSSTAQQKFIGKKL